MTQAFLEVEIKPGNPKHRVSTSKYDFSGKVVACLSVTIHDADNHHIYVRFNDKEDEYEFKRGTIGVEGLVDVKKIWNHLPTDQRSTMSVPELVISKGIGSKKLNIIRSQMDMMRGYNQSFHDMMNQRERMHYAIHPHYLGGIDPYRDAPLNPVETKPVKKSRKLLLLM